MLEAATRKVIKTACQLIVKSAKDLLDISLPDEEIATINIICTNEEIAGYHDLKTRKAGNRRFIEFHILVAPNTTAEQSHEITRKMSAYISSNLRKP
ncbi:MAG: hypothetical protein LE168_01480 [Endomicrobium sp.]|nr:hypothetical protein [Endomicrobium sp.]